MRLDTKNSNAASAVYSQKVRGFKRVLSLHFRDLSGVRPARCSAENGAAGQASSGPPIACFAEANLLCGLVRMLKWSRGHAFGGKCFWAGRVAFER